MVHGPLIATLLLHGLVQHLPPEYGVRRFVYRARTPLFGPAVFTTCGHLNVATGRATLWACGPNGERVMDGTADVTL